MSANISIMLTTNFTDKPDILEVGKIVFFFLLFYLKQNKISKLYSGLVIEEGNTYKAYILSHCDLKLLRNWVNDQSQGHYLPH